MAIIYTKGSKKTLIPNTGEGILRRFNFGTDWTEMRLGFFMSVVSSGSSDANGSAETLSISGPTDLFTFGIKDSSQTVPGQTGSLFVGIRSFGSSSQVVSAAPNLIVKGSSNNKATGYNGTSLASLSPDVPSADFVFATPSASLSSGYAGFLGLKLVIANRGTSSQTIALTVAVDAAATDYSAESLRTYLNNGSYSSTDYVVSWNNGSVAYDIPDCYWLRLPFFNNRARIACIRAIRYAP